MNTMNQNPETGKSSLATKTQGVSVQNSSSSFAAMVHQDVAYHELAEIPVQQIDPLERLQQNVDQLAQMSLKMQFMMREVRYLLKM